MDKYVRPALPCTTVAPIVAGDEGAGREGGAAGGRDGDGAIERAREEGGEERCEGALQTRPGEPELRTCDYGGKK